MDAVEYKHVVLGLIFLKYISDAFEERRAPVLAEWGEDAAEDRDEYIAENIFWVPAEARWTHLRAQARQPTVGLTVDQAMVALERDNPALKDVLPRDYARPAIDKRRLGQLIALISNIQVGDAEARSRDVLGRVYAPCCGSSGMFVQSMAFIRAHASSRFCLLASWLIFIDRALIARASIQPQSFERRLAQVAVKDGVRCPLDLHDGPEPSADASVPAYADSCTNAIHQRRLCRDART